MQQSWVSYWRALCREVGSPETCMDGMGAWGDWDDNFSQILMKNALKPPEGCPGCCDLPGSMSACQPLEQPPIPGYPSVLVTSTALVPPAVRGEFCSLEFDVLGDTQGWGWGGTGGGVKVWSLLPHPRGCPGSPLLEQGGRADFSPSHSGDVSEAAPELPVRCPLMRCCRLLCWQCPLAPVWLGFFSVPKTSGAALFQKLWLGGLLAHKAPHRLG